LTSRVFRRAWRSSASLTLGLLLATLLAGVLPAVAAWLGKLLVDAVVEKERAAAIALLGAEAAVMVALVGAQRIGRTCRTLLGLRLGDDVRAAIADRARGLSLETLESPEVQDELARARKQAGSRPAAYLDHALVAGRAGIALSASAVLLVGLHWAALPVVVVAALPGFFVEMHFARSRWETAHRRTARRREQSYLENILAREDFAKEVRLFETGDLLLRRFRGFSKELYDEQARIERRGGRAAVAAGVFATALLYGAYAAVVLAAVAGDLSIGEMTMALVILRQCQGAVEQLLMSISNLAQDRLYLRDVFAFLDRPLPGEDHGLTAGPVPDDGLRFEAVSFTYPGSTEPALAEVSFHLPPGAVLGVVGENGSGKSTLLKLMTRLYDPSEGRITLDGLDLRAWNPTALRRRMATVLQDFAKYKLTVRENVGLGDVERLGDEEACARAAAAGEAVFSEKLGFDQRLGRAFPGGVDLSGGQWQKLALARALFREDADLRILDEPTASIDARTEAAIFDRLYGTATTRMTVVVAHRLAALTRADEILVLEGGEVVERGDHAALLRHRGSYATMFALQAAEYTTTREATGPRRVH